MIRKGVILMTVCLKEENVRRTRRRGVGTSVVCKDKLTVVCRKVNSSKLRLVKNSDVNEIVALTRRVVRSMPNYSREIDEKQICEYADRWLAICATVPDENTHTERIIAVCLSKPVYWNGEPFWYVTNLCVHPGYVDNGLQYALMKKTQDFVFTDGVRICGTKEPSLGIICDVHVDNEYSMRNVLKLGYKPVKGEEAEPFVKFALMKENRTD